MVAIAYGVARAAVTAASSSKPAGSAEGASKGASKGFFARLLDAMIAARARQAAIELNSYRHLQRAYERQTLASKRDALPFGD
jgi:hypothetical protein